MIPAEIKDAFPSIDMTCEEHPWLEWPHEDCLGPGMPVTASLAMLRSCDAERAVVSAAEQWASSQIVGVAELVAERERAFWRAVDALLSLREGT